MVIAQGWHDCIIRPAAVIGRELVRCRRPGRVGDVADHGRGGDRADAEGLGQAGAGGADRRGEFLAGLAQLGVDAAQVGQVLGGHVVPGRGHRVGRVVRGQDRGGLGRGEDPAAGHSI
jgi:hypothetical protein